jgi:hypothetical protein
MSEFSYMDGDVEDLAVLMGSANLGRQNIDYVGFNGEAMDEEDEFYNAFGDNIRRKLSRRKSRSSGSRPRTKSTSGGSRTRRSSSKRRPRGRLGSFVNNTLDRFGFSEKAMADKRRIEMEQAKANQALASNANSGPDLTTLLATPAPRIIPPKKPMSKGLKIGLIAGGVLGVAAIVYFVVKSKKASNGKKAKK